MARYRAKRPLFVSKLIGAGEEFESDLPPGRAWEPMDDEARAKVEAYQKDNRKVIAIADRFEGRTIDPAAVEIPDDWRLLHPTQRRNLAQKLGAQSNVKTADADIYIEAELERRSSAA